MSRLADMSLVCQDVNLSAVETPYTNRGVSDTSSLCKIPPENRVKLDYFAITFHQFSVEDLCTMIGIPRGEWLEGKSSVTGYDRGLRFGHLRIVWSSSRTDMGVHLHLSGKGVDEFAERYGDDETFVPMLLGLAELGTLTRLDIAYDVVDGSVTPEHFERAWQKGLIVSRMKNSHGWETSDKKGYHGRTFYLGSRTSECVIRVYDKAAQLRVDGDYTRIELEFKGKQAMWALGQMCLFATPGRAFMELLQGKMYVVQGTGDSNKARRKQARWWRSLVHGADGVKYQSDKVDRTVERALKHIHTQAERNIALISHAIDRGYFGSDYDVSRWFAELVERGTLRLKDKDWQLLDEVEVAEPSDWAIADVIEDKDFYLDMFMHR